MKTDVSIMCRLCLLASFALNLLNVQAFGPSTQPELPNFDRRAVGTDQQAAAENPVALTALRAQLPDARVHFDERVGTPKWIVAERGFLSGPGGSGRGIRAQTAAAFGVKEPQRATKAFLKEHQSLFGFGPEILATARLKRQFITTHNGLTTTVWEQDLDGIAVFEGVLISHETKNEELVNLASHFIPNPAQAADAAYPNRAALVSSPTISAKQAVALAAQNLGETLNEAEVSAVETAVEGAEQRQHFQAPPLNGDARVKLVWLPMNRSNLRLCWDAELTSRARGELYRMLVDVQTGEVLVRHCLTEYISDASYQVFTSDSPSPFSPGCSTPCTTQPPVVSRTLVTLGALDTNASPAGWIDDGANETRGNNVDAHTDRDNNNSPDLPRPQGSPFRVFDFALDLTQAPSVYTNAAVTDLFYWCNWVHDKLYALGFTEAAGNFQSNNFARGGLGNDALQADAQDGSGSNNANMSTPSDGSAPRMQMFVFTGPTPDRDGDFDHEIVIHEYIHGLSNRRVGGGVGMSALQSRGMGEGWSDWYALTMLSEPGDDVNGVYAKGGYATYLFSGLTTNYYFGIRRYPYSTDMLKNPLTFKDINPTQASTHPGIPRSPVIGTTADEVHNMGEVWCVALWDARANLIAKHGYNTGNQLILELVTDGMNLSPANPNFIQARNAILQADLVNSGGANQADLWSAFAKRGLGYSATSPASSTTTGLVEAYDVIDDMFINPLSLAASGPVGGPFSPNPLSFVLTNTGSANLNWSLASTSTWFSVSPTSGGLSVGGPAAVVTATILPAAGSLPMGSHVATIWFTNQTSGVVQQGSVTVSAVGSGVADDFDPGLDLSQWSAFGGVVGSTVMANSYGGYVSAPNSLWFGDGGNRFATTIPINTSGGGGIGFAIRLANGSSSTWETADSLPSEGLVMESSTDGGVNWTILGNYDTTAYYNWTTVTSTIPLVARAAATQFRWRQMSHSGSGYDHWALENVIIDATPAAILTLDIVSLVAEGGLPLNATVTASPTPTNDLTVNLASLDTSELTVPAMVTILAGQSNAMFTLTIVDDAELDGTQTTQITAAAGGHSSAATPVTIFDNETATLTVQLPGSVTEGGATAQGTVSASAAPTANMTVTLLSSDTTEIQVPPSVVLPAGQTSTVFNITVVNDTLIDGNQTATVTVQVPGWTDGMGNIIVYDNEPTNLVVTLPASAREGNGVLLNAGAVRIAGSLPTNLVVNLLSTDTSELTVPPTSTILAGQTTATFDLTVVDDPDVDSSQTVAVNASAPGFAPGSTNMTVTDNESPPEPFSPTPAHFATNVIQTSDLSWQSGAVPGEVITNDVYLGTSFVLGPANLLGSTTNTTWDLPLLAPQTAYYWQIVARKTGVTPGPIWRFTTRGVDHFVWDTIPSPQGVSQPFGVTIVAKDAFETTVSNFTGTVELGVSGGGLATNTILGGMVHTTSSSGTYTLGYAFTPNANLTVSHVRSYSGTKVSIWTDAGVLVASRNVSGPAGSWTETPLASPVTLTAGTTYRLGFYTSGGSYYYHSSRPSTFPNGTLVDGYYHTSSDGFPTTFYNADKVIFLCDIRYTVGAAVSVPISPTVSGLFVNGTWTDNLSVLAPISEVTLRADDGGGHTGESNPFAVELRNDVAVSLADSPDPVSLGGNLTYAITVTNIGPAGATGVVVTNLLPVTATLVSVTPSQGAVTTNGNMVVCELGAMAGNASASVTIVATTTSTGTLTNQVSVSRSDADAYLANNSAVAVTAVQMPVISINDVSTYEGNAGSANAAFTVSVTPAPAVATSVNFATANSSAVSPGDFFSTNGTLNFVPGQSTQTVAVVVVSDGLYELNETFTVNLSSATNATISDSTGVGTILNDDPMPTLSISDVTLKEGNLGTTNAEFVVSLSAASGLSTTFSYGTANGNASSGSDYTSRSGSLTIPAGSTSTNIVIAVNGDFTIESDEVFYLDLSSAGNAILLKREGVGLILNDDGLPGDVDRFTWSAMASPQYVGQPIGVTINAWDAFNNPAVNFTGPANLSAVSGSVTTNILGANTTTASFPIYTGYYAQRTQVIYPAGELGGAGRITALALDVSSVPGLVLNNWTIRLKHTALTNYTSYVWESTNWTMVYQINLPVNATGWVLFPLSTPFDYDGTNSLMVDFSFYNSTTYGAGACRTTSRSTTRTIHTATSSYGSPLTWSGSSPSPSTTTATPNLQLIRGGESYPLQPLITGSFSNGTWSGNLTALASATNVVLRVDDGLGHNGMSGSFAVQLRDDISLAVADSPDPVSIGGNLTYTLSVTNIGPSSAMGVMVTNLLPPDVALVSVNSTQGTCTNFGQTVVCDLGTMPGDSYVVVAIQATPSTAGLVTNHAFVSRAGADSLAANNFATNVTSVLVPAITINHTSVFEGNFGQTNMPFTVQLSPASPLTVTVNYGTSNGTAQAGSDYMATSGTLTFLPGQTNQFVHVSIISETNGEGNETFTVNLGNPTNAAIVATATGTILNDDIPVALMPFVEDWESGGFEPYWSVTGTGSYHSLITANNVPRAGTYHLTMDTLSGAARNEVTLTINMAGWTNVLLRYYGREWSDEASGPPSIPFYGGADFDGIAISMDSNAWYEVQGLRDLTSVYQFYQVDLDTTVRTYGLAYTPFFYVRFNQYDNTAITSDGIGIDDIEITGVLLDDLQVSPASALVASGYQGGPFDPSNKVYTVFNTGASNLSWSASSAQNWVTVQPTSGSLAPGLTTNVTVSFNANTAALTNGSYAASVIFSNLATGVPQTRGVQLTVLELPQPPPVPFNPIPTNMATGVSVHTLLSWNGSSLGQNVQASALNGDYGVIDTGGYDSDALTHIQGLSGLTAGSVSWATIASSSGADLYAAYDVIYFSVNATSTDYQNLITAVTGGNSLERYVSLGGTLILNLAGNNGSYTNIGPGGLDYTRNTTHEVATIVSPAHPYATGVGYGGSALTSAMFNNWLNTDHGILSRTPVGTVELLRNPDGLSMVEYSWGAGRVIASTIIFGWAGSTLRFGLPFDNELLYAASGLGLGTARYDVYFGTNAAGMTLIATNVADTSCDPGSLAFDTTYYWQVVASNVIGSVTGAVWQFTTTLDEVHFASAATSVAEDGGSATITVVRENPAGGVLNVQYSTTNGTATAGSDYTPVSGTLIFPAGVMSTNFQVPILEDAASEAYETVQLQLSQPSPNVLLATPSNAVLTIVDNDGPPEFQIVNLYTNNSKVVDHDTQTGDDRGGIAVSVNQAFVTGDSATARFNAVDLTSGVSLGRIVDGLCTDLGTETVYTLGNGTNALTSSGGTVTTLIELNATTGQPTGVVVPLSQSFTMPSSGNGIFSGFGRVVVHNGTSVYDIFVPSGAVTALGAMTRPNWQYSESWSVWGVAEYFGGTLYLTYRQSGTQQIVRSRVPDGLVTSLATFSNLSDMASFTVSLSLNRWYFHYEGNGQFGGSSETLGYADAQFSFISTNPPVILTQPADNSVQVGSNAILTVTAIGSSPLTYQWRKNSVAITDATNAAYTINPVQYSHAGNYSVVVSNAYGLAISSNATLTVLAYSTNVTLYAFDKGWYNAAGNHDPGNQNYFCGDSSSVTSVPLRNWFAFNIPSLPGPVISAQFRVNTYSISSPTGAEAYQLRHVNTPIAALVAGGTGQTYIYNDLADGLIYGNRSFSTTEANQFVTMMLNPDFITNVVAAAGQQFAMGGEISSLDEIPANTEVIFSGSAGNSTDAQLILTLGSNPPPDIITQPVSQSVTTGSNVNFTVMATGAGPLSYQWQRNQLDLSDGGHYFGCTTNTLRVVNCDSNDVASFRCVVSNPYGSTNSADATLTVIPVTYPCLAIANGDFEGGFTLAGGGYIANHWTEWEALPGVAIGYDETSIIHGGTHSQRIRVWGVTNSTSGGVYQRVPVTPGQPYMVSVWAYAGDAMSACYLGVDPSGGTDANGSVTWSSAATSPTWTLKTLTGNAATNYITIFYKVTATDGNKRNGYFDDTLPANSAGPFQLALHQMGNTLTLTWPECPNAQLQRAGDLTGSLWTPATNQVSINGGQKSVTLTPTGAAGYFRLVLQ